MTFTISNSLLELTVIVKSSLVGGWIALYSRKPS